MTERKQEEIEIFVFEFIIIVFLLSTLYIEINLKL